MAFPTPSIGDILMLSHLAWKVGCAFSAGRHAAPVEFQGVEKELRALTGAITMLAETLDDEDSIYARSDERTQRGLAIIIGCCRQSLGNLESFVAQYQIIGKGDDGINVQGGWRKLLLKNWRTIAWTTEGGNIQSLRNMLAMHSQSIQLAIQALQTGSLSRLEKVIEPMASKMDNIHSKLNGNIDRQIAEIHHVILSLKAAQPQSSTTSPESWSTFQEDRAANAPSSPPLKSPLRRPPSYGSTTPTSPPTFALNQDNKFAPQRQASTIDTDLTPDLSDTDVASSPPFNAAARTMYRSGGSSSSRSSGPAPEMYYHLQDASPPDYHYDSDAQHQQSFGGRKASSSAYSAQSYGVSPTSRPLHRISDQLRGLNLGPPALEHGIMNGMGSSSTHSVYASSTTSRRHSNMNDSGSTISALSPVSPDDTGMVNSYSRSSSVSAMSAGNSTVNGNGKLLPLTPVRKSSMRGADGRALSPKHLMREDREDRDARHATDTSSRRPMTPSGALETVEDMAEEESLQSRIAAARSVRSEHERSTNDGSDSIFRAASTAGAASLADSVIVASTAPARPSNTDDITVASEEDQRAFERGLLMNASMEYEGNASSIDYTIPDEEKPGDFVMQNACSDCKVYIITRRTKIPSGKTRFATSIWILSDDRRVRLQVPLPEDSPVIPYTVWNSPSKPIIRLPLSLRYHDTSLDDKPLCTESTNWLTFTFPKPKPGQPQHGASPTLNGNPISSNLSNIAPASTTFQNALMDNCQVLLSVCTKRTMRIFDGLAGNFAFAEQLCGLENLRIVLDPATGVVSVMLHYSPNFGEGYMVFGLNVGGESVRVREEDERVVRVKGLKIAVGERDKKNGGRRPSAPSGLERGDSYNNGVAGGSGSKGKKGDKTKQEWVSGAKIEFSTRDDKEKFMQILREVQNMGSVRA